MDGSGHEMFVRGLVIKATTEDATNITPQCAQKIVERTLRAERERVSSAMMMMDEALRVEPFKESSFPKEISWTKRTLKYDCSLIRCHDGRYDVRFGKTHYLAADLLWRECVGDEDAVGAFENERDALSGLEHASAPSGWQDYLTKKRSNVAADGTVLWDLVVQSLTDPKLSPISLQARFPADQKFGSGYLRIGATDYGLVSAVHARTDAPVREAPLTLEVEVGYSILMTEVKRLEKEGIEFGRQGYHTMFVQTCPNQGSCVVVGERLAGKLLSETHVRVRCVDELCSLLQTWKHMYVRRTEAASRDVQVPRVDANRDAASSGVQPVDSTWIEKGRHAGGDTSQAADGAG